MESIILMVRCLLGDDFVRPACHTGNPLPCWQLFDHPLAIPADKVMPKTPTEKASMRLVFAVKGNLFRLR